MPDIRDIFLDDTLVPSVFITDYMPNLGRTALEVYLMSLLHMSAERKVKAKPVRELLGLDKENFKAAVCELAGHGIVATESDFSSYVMLNLKRRALDRYYHRKRSDSMEDAVARTEADEERSKLITSVNETFFHELMGPVWFHAIDRWFELYDFEPTVIYQMFSDAAARGTLKGPNYLNAVAADYYKNGVKTFDDLVKYKEEFAKAAEVSTQVGKKLNKTMTHYDKTMVRKWIKDYGYDMSVIELALAKSVRIAEPNMNYFDSILRSWHEAGLKTPEEIKKLEKNRQHMQSLKRKRSGKSSKKEDAFEQRAYEDAFFEQFAGISYLDDEDAGSSKPAPDEQPEHPPQDDADNGE